MGWLELIETPSVGILHRSDCTWLCCLLCQYSVWKLLLNDSKWNLVWKSWKLSLCTGLLFLLFRWLSIIFGVTYFRQKKLLLGIARKCPHFFSQSQIKLSFGTKYLDNLSTLYPQISQNKELKMLFLWQKLDQKNMEHLPSKYLCIFLELTTVPRY